MSWAIPFHLYQDKTRLIAIVAKSLRVCKVKIKRKYGIKIDGQILVIYPSEILY